MSSHSSPFIPTCTHDAPKMHVKNTPERVVIKSTYSRSEITSKYHHDRPITTIYRPKTGVKTGCKTESHYILWSISMYFTSKYPQYIDSDSANPSWQNVSKGRFEPLMNRLFTAKLYQCDHLVGATARWHYVVSVKTNNLSSIAHSVCWPTV